jgi:hypothetical protein
MTSKQWQMREKTFLKRFDPQSEVYSKRNLPDTGISVGLEERKPQLTTKLNVL